MSNSQSRFGTTDRMAWFNAVMPQRCVHVTTIPAMLAEFSGNISKVSEILGANRCTVTKYKSDQDLSRHVVVNGQLFIQGRLCNGHKKEKDNAATS
ncbi:hypothetical protein [Pantoea sp. CCBC3-3-1]|uniref:hypothetical protein n=1 Tax=Pantoea sp. CCBC3-3-1 TaxID=2490851 RepID=UPI0011BE56FB|nr:hypothetical protein [Pantoea sp. CCBC3-3-1]